MSSPTADEVRISVSPSLFVLDPEEPPTSLVRSASGGVTPKSASISTNVCLPPSAAVEKIDLPRLAALRSRPNSMMHGQGYRPCLSNPGSLPTGGGLGGGLMLSFAANNASFGGPMLSSESGFSGSNDGNQQQPFTLDTAVFVDDIDTVLHDLGDEEGPQSLGKGCSGSVDVKLYRGQHVAVKRYDFSSCVAKQALGAEMHIAKLIEDVGPEAKAHLLYHVAAFRTHLMGYGVSDVMSGGDLSRLVHTAIDHIGLSENAVRSVASQLVNGLTQLSELGIVHRDLKPSNVLCDRVTGTVKICDFGCAGIVSTSAGQLRGPHGSRLYMAPERLLGEGYSFKSDIWSFGMVIASLALGEHPLLGLLGDDLFFNGSADDKYWPMMGILCGEDDLQSLHNHVTHRLSSIGASEEFKAFLCEAIFVPEATRWTAERLRSHAWLRSIGSEAMSSLREELSAKL